MLERLLSPAIYVIDQLNYAKKFILVSLFFYIPLLFMSYVLVDQAYKKIVTADKKVQAGQLMTEMLAMRQAAENYRNIQAVYIALDAGNDNEVAIKAKKSFENSYKAVLEQHADYFENDHPGTFIEDMNDAAKAVANFGNSNGEISVAMQVINKLIAKIDQHILLVQESSGLSSDNDADIKAALSIISSAIYKVHLHTSGVASGAFVGIEMKFLNSSAYDFLDNNYQDLVGAMEVLNVAYGEALPDSVKTPEVQAQFDKLVKDTDSLLLDFDDNVINASALPATIDRLYRATGETIDTQYQLSSLLLVQIGKRLVVQKQAAEAYMLKIIAAVVAVFVITVYLYSAFFVSFRKAIWKISTGAEKMAMGDMTFEMHSNAKDEMGKLVEHFNESSDRVRNLVQQVSQSANNVYDLCNTSQDLALETNELIREQLDSTAHVSVAITQMSQTAQGIADCSQGAEKSVHDAQEKARAGEVVVSQSVEKIDNLCQEIQLASDNINELSDDSKNIAQVVDEIRGIAEQTNLLALNAAIEAARAGEQGRGFAVVADEVRSLSQRTHSSTSNIESIIQKFLKKIENSVGTMERSLTMASDTASESGKIIEALHEINATLQNVVNINEQVNRSMAQQADVTNEIDSNVTQIKSTGELTSEKSSESTVASVSMAEETQRLRDALNQFKV